MRIARRPPSPRTTTPTTNPTSAARPSCLPMTPDLGVNSEVRGGLTLRFCCERPSHHA